MLAHERPRSPQNAPPVLLPRLEIEAIDSAPFSVRRGYATYCATQGLMNIQESFSGLLGGQNAELDESLTSAFSFNLDASYKIEVCPNVIFLGLV